MIFSSDFRLCMYLTFTLSLFYLPCYLDRSATFLTSSSKNDANTDVELRPLLPITRSTQNTPGPEHQTDLSKRTDRSDRFTATPPRHVQSYPYPTMMEGEDSYNIDTHELLAGESEILSNVHDDSHIIDDDKDRKNEERRKRYKERKEELEQQQQQHHEQHEHEQHQHEYQHEEHGTSIDDVDISIKEDHDIDPTSILTSNMSAEVVSAAAIAAAAYGGLLPDADDIVQSQEIAQLTQTAMGHDDDHDDHDHMHDHEHDDDDIPLSELGLSHEQHLASRRQKDRERYASMSKDQREVYNCKRREQYHRQSEISRKKRRERERVRYHSLPGEKAKDRNVRRASLERDRYKKLSGVELSGRNAKRRARAAALRAQKKQSVASVNGEASSPAIGEVVGHMDPVHGIPSVSVPDSPMDLPAPPVDGDLEDDGDGDVEDDHDSIEESMETEAEV